MQATQNVQDNFLTTTDWGRRNGYSPRQVKDLCSSQKLDYVWRSGRRVIDENAKPKDIVQMNGWMTIKEFAELHKMSEWWARRLIREGKLKIKRVGGRILVWAETQLIQRERLQRSGQRFVYWETATAQ